MSTSSRDPFAKKVYLRTLDDPLLPARYSQGAQRRAVQVQGFLRPLQRLAATRLVLSDAATLLVLDRSDWSALFSYPYGFPFVRSFTKDAHGPTIVVAASYPERLLHRFDDVLVRGAKAGVRAPGDLREFFDLLIGFEWGHAVLHASGLHSKTKWFNEWLAIYLYLLALFETGQGDLAERVVAWARLTLVGSGVAQLPLGELNYPRMKMGLDTLLWFQGMFTLRAAEVLETHTWDLPLTLRAVLADTKKRSVKPLLVDLEPGFADWLELFGSVETSDVVGSQPKTP